MVPNEKKHYLKGLYGKSPIDIDEEFRKSIIGDQEVITDRPANHLEPQFETLKEEIKHISSTDEDVLTYILFPQVGKKFLEQKYNK